MDMRKVVGANVLRLRLERCLSQEELSFRSGFGRAYLSGLETGKRNPTVVTLWELAVVLDVTPAELVTPTTGDAGPSNTTKRAKRKTPRRNRA